MYTIDRAIAFALLHIIAHHEVYIIVKASLSNEVPKGFSNIANHQSNKRDTQEVTSAKKTNRSAANIDLLDFVQALSETKATYYTPTQLAVIDKLKQTIHAASDVDAAMRYYYINNILYS